MVTQDFASPHLNKDQLRTAYPNIDDFFALKRKNDPKLIFMNSLYTRYAYA